MAPSALFEEAPTSLSHNSKDSVQSGKHFEVPKPHQNGVYHSLELSGALEEYTQFELTPIIGTKLEDIDLHAILHAANCDAKIRDIAITIARRGVCVFPNQISLSIQDQKLLCHKLGQLTHRPTTSSLVIHPLNQTQMPDGTIDAELVTLARDPSKKLVQQAGFSRAARGHKQSHADGWHNDCAYENTPADFTLLHMKTTPPSGGDTLFASAYETYDLLSEPYAKFLEGLTATFTPPGHRPENIVDRMWNGPRGAIDNVGPELLASHCAVRTNPITGWKALYAAGHHLSHFDGVADEESEMIKRHIFRLIVENHQLQVRVKWSANDLVIWDNRSCYHSATFDYTAHRSGNRICGCGEKPYLDPSSSGRRVAIS